MNTFKLKFKTGIVAGAYAALAVCAAAFALNLWRCVKNGGFTGFYVSVQYVVIFAVTLFAPVLLLSVVYNSRYEITDAEFITRFGFIKSRFPIADMTKAVFKEKTCQLAVYSGETFMVFGLNEKWKQEFIDLLLSKNKNILYDETDDFEPDDEKKEKEEKNDKK